MNTQLVSGSKLALALAISAVLGACGGGGGGDSSTPAKPVATNGAGSTTTSTAGGTTTATNSTPAASAPAATAPSAPATTPAATTPATNSPVATAPAVTAPSNNAQTPSLVNRAMYEQMRRECQTPSGPSDLAVVACAAGVYVGRDLWDGKECTVKLAKDGEVTFTVGDKVHVFRMTETEYFEYRFVNSSAERAPYLLDVHISGYSAEDATEKSHGFMLNVNPKGDGSTLPDSIEIGYKYGGKISSDELASCKMPL